MGFGFRSSKPTLTVGFGFRVSGFGFRWSKPTLQTSLRITSPKRKGKERKGKKQKVKKERKREIERERETHRVSHSIILSFFILIASIGSEGYGRVSSLIIRNALSEQLQPIQPNEFKHNTHQPMRSQHIASNLSMLPGCRDDYNAL